MERTEPTAGSADNSPLSSEVPVETVRPRRWGIGSAIAVLVAAQFLSGIAAIIFLAAKGIDAQDGLDNISIADTALLQIPLVATFILGSLAVVTVFGRGAREDLGWRFRVKDLWGIPLGVLCQFPGVVIITAPMIWLFDVDQDKISEPARELADRADASGAVGLVLLAIIVVIAAPLAEETYFRGMLQTALRGKFSILPAALMTAVTFGITHFQPLQFPALALFGLLLSWLTYRRGDIGMAIFTHVGFNATTVAFLALSSSTDSDAAFAVLSFF